jgi:hypothetical protein
MHYPDLAPAFVAARAGYDVWLGNSRGNTYSKGHLKLKADNLLPWHISDRSKYWAFDWTTMGQFDIPAVLYYITE